MIEEKIVRMVYSNDHEMRNLGISILLDSMKDTSHYNDIKTLITHFPHKEGRKELRILAQRKHLKLLRDERRISQNLQDAGE